MNTECLKFDGVGLIPAIVQDWESGQVLMLAYLNSEALEKTLTTGMVHYYSRSRQRLWLKGETSGNYQFLKEALVDCDEDALLLRVEQRGAACHTGRFSCFGTDRPLEKPLAIIGQQAAANAWETVRELWQVVLDRQACSPAASSYTARLLHGEHDDLLKKIGEEASEVIIAAKNNCKQEIVHEVADLAFHCLLLLAWHRLCPTTIALELQRRRKHGHAR